MSARAPARSFLPHLLRVKASTCFGRRVTPPFVTLYVTTRCDEQCIHCYYWDELNPRPDRDFALSEFERSLASMGEIYNLFIGGGEPFLRNDLAAIEDPQERLEKYESMVATAYDRAKAVNAATNFGIDDVIDPADTRSWIAAGLRSLPPAPPRTKKKRPYIDTW